MNKKIAGSYSLAESCSKKLFCVIEENTEKPRGVGGSTGFANSRNERGSAQTAALHGAYPLEAINLLTIVINEFI